MLRSIRNLTLPLLLGVTPVFAQEAKPIQSLSEFENAVITAHRLALANQERYKASCPVTETQPNPDDFDDLSAYFEANRPHHADTSRYNVGVNNSYSVIRTMALPLGPELSDDEQTAINFVTALNNNNTLIGELHNDVYKNDGLQAIYYPFEGDGFDAVLLLNDWNDEEVMAVLANHLNSGAIGNGQALIMHGDYDRETETFEQVSVIDFDINTAGIQVPPANGVGAASHYPASYLDACGPK